MKIKTYSVISLFLLLFTQAYSQEIRRGEVYGRKVVIIDNGKARLSVTPEIGARVLEFNLIDPEVRTLQIHRHHIGLSPDDQWAGAEYGGYSDMATTGWPGEIWGETFEVEETTNNGVKAVKMTVEKTDVKHVRTLSLLPDSTVMRYTSEQVNTANRVRDLTVRIHGEFALGEAADDYDRIWLTDENGNKMIPFRLGWENPRFTFEKPGDWLAVTDIRERVALVRWFFPVTDDRVLVWHGHNEGLNVRDENGGFYGIDRFYNAKDIAPGKSLQASEELAIIQGLDRVDFAVADGHLAGALELNQSAYGSNQPVTATCAVGGGEAGKARTCRLQFVGTDGASVDLGEVSVPAFEAGEIASASTTFTPGTSGVLNAELLDLDGETVVATFARDIAIDTEGHTSASAALEALKAQAKALVTALNTKNLSDQSTGKAQIELAHQYVEAVSDLFEQGHFSATVSEAERRSDLLETALARIEAATQGDNEAREKATEATAALR